MKLRTHCISAVLAMAVLTAGASRVRAEVTEDVYTRTLRGTGLILTPDGSGTAWVVDLARGLLVTNHHVVTSHNQVEVVFPEYGKSGRPVAEMAHYVRHAPRLRAEVIDADGPRDLALIRLRERLPESVVALKLADREPRPGERMHSVGNPGASGALWIYSTGMVRQVYRKEWRYVDGPARVARVIEMQSPINPGDSGGPVVNDAGEVVGVVSGRKTDAALMSWCIAGAEVQSYMAEVRTLVNPKTAAAFRLRGTRALERGQAIRAVEDLSAAHRLDPKSADILADRAMAQRTRKDYDLALDDVAEALRINPQHAMAYNVRGCIHTDRGENDLALKEFRRAIQINPRIAIFHANRGQAHANKDEAEPAIRSYDEALRLSPDVAEWYYRRGLALEQLSQLEKAEQNYVAAVQRDPSYKDRLTQHKVRIVRVANKTGQKIRVHIRYEGQAADGRWAWLPGNGVLSWEFAPGEVAVLMHEQRPVLARRMRIWAESTDTNAAWLKVKEVDTWTAPTTGYRSGQRPEMFTYTFNP
jgi:tetratricopeptide (TPR) repeat protein